MKVVFMFIVVMVVNLSVADANWEGQIAKYRKLIDDNLIWEQYQAFKDGRLPKIADEIIKKIQIKDSEEELVDIKEQSNPRIKMLPDPQFPFAGSDYNSGFSEASKVRVTLYKKLEKLLDELDKMSCDFGFEPGQIKIMVFEGLRSLKTQAQLFSNEVEKIKRANPHFTRDQAVSEASKWISPIRNNIPAHSTGGAIDIRLLDTKNGRFLDMGMFGVIWEKNPKAPTFSDDISDEQVANRLFLLISARNVGLINYPYEFWHFSTGDRYAAYWLKAQPLSAVYDGRSGSKIRTGS